MHTWLGLEALAEKQGEEGRDVQEPQDYMRVRGPQTQIHSQGLPNLAKQAEVTGE